MLLVLIEGTFDVQRWDVIQWHTVRAKFRENLSILKDVKVGEGQCWHLHVRNEGRLICTLSFRVDLTCCVEPHCHPKRLNHVWLSQNVLSTVQSKTCTRHIPRDRQVATDEFHSNKTLGTTGWFKYDRH